MEQSSNSNNWKYKLLEKQKSSTRVYRCSWGTCNNDSRYYHKRTEMDNVFFLPIPKPTRHADKCKTWIRACNRPHTQLSMEKVSKYHYICSKHFVEEFGPTADNPHPVSADIYASQNTGRKRPASRNFNVPSKKVIKIEPTSTVSIEACNVKPLGTTSRSQHENNIFNVSGSEICCKKCGHNFELSPNTSKRIIRGQFTKEILKTDENCLRYTGVPNVSGLKFLFSWIEPCAKKIKLWDGKNKLIPGKTKGRKRTLTTLFEEFLLTLVKLRRGYDSRHLCYLFGISQSQISRIFMAWINLLSRCLGQTIKWPSGILVSANLPASFSKYPKTRGIIDCTEFKIEKPFRPRAQKSTWSNYKHSNTCKLLVCIMPSGAITFLSKVYNGAVSDVSIVDKSGFLSLLEPGDDIMADRGFNIRHLLLPKKATLNIPAFSHGKVLSSKAVKKSRNIASVRIHVERAIGRMKTFRILNGTIPLKTRFLLNQITTVVAALSNLHDCLA